MHLARKTYACTLLAEGVNISVLSKLLEHGSIQATLDSYGAFNYKLMILQVSIIHEKLVAKDERFEIYVLKDNSAQNEIIQNFARREKDN